MNKPTLWQKLVAAFRNRKAVVVAIDPAMERALRVPHAPSTPPPDYVRYKETNELYRPGQGGYLQWLHDTIEGRDAYEPLWRRSSCDIRSLENLATVLSNKEIMKGRLFTKFWKQAKHLNTTEECYEAAELAADLLRFMVENPDYVAHQLESVK